MARLVAAMLALGLNATAHPHAWLPIAVASTLVVYSAVSLISRDTRRAAIEWTDPLLATAAIAATGGLESNLLLFGGIAAVGIGLSLGTLAGGIAGALVAAGSAPLALRGIALGTAAPNQVATWIALFPLAGVGAGLARAVWSVAESGATLALSETNRVLTMLNRLAVAMPGGLDLGSVAGETIREIRTAFAGSSAAAFMAREGDALNVVGSFGLQEPHLIEAGFDALPSVGTVLVPASYLGLPGEELWLAAPLRRDEHLVGLLLVACIEGPDAAARRALEAIATRAGLGLENAALFARVCELSSNQERRRLARELHDGVAQTLIHLRFELEMLQRRATEAEFESELTRLERAVVRANGEVRSIVLGLRSPAVHAGLAEALGEHVQELRGPGRPDIVFSSRGDVCLAVAQEAEIFRIAQEAVSNALRHAAPRTIRVALERTGDGARLVVEDDGRGISRRANAGVGLEAMRERAATLGARIAISRRRGGGTRVEVLCPGRRIA